MTTVLQLPPPDLGDLSLSAVEDTFARRLTMTDGDMNDTRHPALPSTSRHLSLQQPQMATSRPDRRGDGMPSTDGSRAQSWIEYSPVSSRYPSHAGRTPSGAGYSGTWMTEKVVVEEPAQDQQQPQPPLPPDTHDQQEARLPDGIRSGAYKSPSGSFPYPNQHHDGAADREQRLPSNVAATRPPSAGFRPSLDVGGVLQHPPEMGQRASGVDQYRENPAQLPPSSPRHPSLPAAGIGAAPGPSSSNMPPIVPLSAGPSYNAIPVSTKPRAYAQQPTYITPTSAAPSPINPVYGPQQGPREEICVECAMRDQDMADVDVTSPGVWERESDALYEDLLRREEEEETGGLPPQESVSRPKARGGPLSEENIKLWLSMNPKEPSSRLQTLDQYVKSQRTLLEAEALAHARALRESRQLDDKMRDAYSQLRRSAYELGSSAQPIDDTGGVRIKAPRSPSVSTPAFNAHSREVTLLENGMIVEHVDVRKEEREERERRKREEKRERSRVRKSSRTSRAADVMSVYSLQTPLHTDSGFFSGVKSDSRYSQSISASARPSSVMTGGNERPHTLLRAQSQASFSDMQSVGSAASPRRSRFFGLKNLSSGWRSQDSLAPSGSMIDMHVALQREQAYFQSMTHPEAVDIGSNAPTVRLGESWPRMEGQGDPAPLHEAQSLKKPKGFRKIWKLVTGSVHHKVDTHMNGRGQSRSFDRTDDDLPLAPPPPLSYLVNRDQGGASARRHVSTPSLPSSISPNTLSPYAPSPPTAPSSLIPSPTSSRRSTADRDEARKNGDAAEQDEQGAQETSFPDSDSRGRTTQSSRTLSSGAGPLTPPLPPSSPSQRTSSPAMRRDKSLPPLPGDAQVDFPNHLTHPLPDGRPQTVFTYDPRTLVDGLSPPQAPFRTAETRRQSFGGLGSKAPFFTRTLPGRGSLARTGALPPFLAEEKYGEFGVPRMPLAQLSQGSLAVPGEKVRKRKSRFGLGALFGRKAQEDGGEQLPPSPALPMAHSPIHAEVPFEAVMQVQQGGGGGVHASGYASPLSTSASAHAPRMSVGGKKNIEELVEQDPDFIAYRYPSSDQRLDLLR